MIHLKEIFIKIIFNNIMNKVFLLILIFGIIYIFCNCTDYETMANIDIIKVKPSKINYIDKLDDIQYIEFMNVNNENDKYVMIDYSELPKDQIRDIIKMIRLKNIDNLEKYLCPQNINQPKSEISALYIDECINSVAQQKPSNLPLFLINKKDISLVNNILTVKTLFNMKQNEQTEYISLLLANSPITNIDFNNNNKILDATKINNINNMAILFMDKHNQLVVNTTSYKEIKETDLFNLTLNELILDDKNKTKLYYLTN